MKVGYVYIISDPQKLGKIVLGRTEYLPRKVVADYREATGIQTAEMSWFMHLPDTELGFRMASYKLMPYKSYLEKDTYNIAIDTALCFFLKDIAEFFGMFKYKSKINWKIDQLVSYEELCAKTHIESLYPLLHRAYIRNKLSILKNRPTGRGAE
jgi:hypothetical protein